MKRRYQCFGLVHERSGTSMTPLWLNQTMTERKNGVFERSMIPIIWPNYVIRLNVDEKSLYLRSLDFFRSFGLLFRSRYLLLQFRRPTVINISILTLRVCKTWICMARTSRFNGLNKIHVSPEACRITSSPCFTCDLLLVFRFLSRFTLINLITVNNVWAIQIQSRILALNQLIRKPEDERSWN